MPHPESEAAGPGPPADQSARQEPRIDDPPAALWSRNPLAWFRFFGPGAIVASVTVGSGEIVFPSRGGALFGYQLLWIYQAAFLTGLAAWLKPLYDLAIFLAFFGILLGGPEMAYRLWSAYLESVPGLGRRLKPRLVRAAAIGWTLVPALIILWTLRWLQQTGAVEPGFDLLDLVTPAGIFTSFVASFFCFANLWTDRRFLPPPLRAPLFLQAVNLAAGGAFLFTAVRAMASYQGVLGYGFLLLLLAGCMLAAWRMRSLYEESPA